MNSFGRAAYPPIRLARLRGRVEEFRKGAEAEIPEDYFPYPFASGTHRSSSYPFCWEWAARYHPMGPKLSRWFRPGPAVPLNISQSGIAIRYPSFLALAEVA